MDKLKKEARKAFFDKKLPKFLNKMQSDEAISVEKLDLLKEWLEEFKVEEEAIIYDIQKYIPDILKDETAPVVSSLFKPLTEEQKKKVESWKKDVEETLSECIALARVERDKLSIGKSIDSGKILDLGLRMLTEKFSFNQLLAYRERLYKVKISEIIDNFNISRREAQDRAEITQEYFEFNVMKKNIETIDEIIIYAKKYQKAF